MFVNSNQYISVSNQKLQVCVSYNLNWLLTIFREELDAPGEAFYGLSTASSLHLLLTLYKDLIFLQQWLSDLDLQNVNIESNRMTFKTKNFNSHLISYVLHKSLC